MPVITVSRQYGSYGDGVVELLCDRLGYRSLDKYLLRNLAAQAGLKPQQVAAMSEERYRPQNPLERFFEDTGPRSRHPVMWTEYGAFMTRDQLASEAIARLIHIAHKAGNVVIVGRGGQVVLREEPDVLHVRLIAPLAVRIRRHQLRAGLAAAAARAEVLEADRASAEFIRRYYDADVADPALYDVIINTARLPLAAAADLIIEAQVARQQPHHL